MIIVLVGLMGTGKSKLSKQLAKDLEFNFLEVSDVVKSLLSHKVRGVMVQKSLAKKQQDPMWLAEPLRHKLSGKKNWVVSGVREVVLLDTIRDLDQQVYVLHVSCNDETRLKRCKDKYENLVQLRKADQVDQQLGVDEVISRADITLNTGGTFRQTRSSLLNLVETFTFN